jgi:hypothetical protein
MWTKERFFIPYGQPYVVAHSEGRHTGLPLQFGRDTALDERDPNENSVKYLY